MSDIRALLRRTAELASDFLESLDDRPVFPHTSVDELRNALGGPLPEEAAAPEEVGESLVAAADQGIVAMPSGRYFGFVIGGGLPAALAADWLTSAWDQNAGLYVGGPRRRPSSRRWCASGCATCSGCRRTHRSVSSPAPRWEASRRLRPPASVCSNAWAGMSAGTVSPEHRAFACSSAHNGTSRSTVRFACSGSGCPRSWLPTARDGWTPKLCARRWRKKTGRPSSARRRAR